ncbi:acyl-CoA mutase large subunit family protein [Patulibacter defluvii]|uniref:acyl-CoA mutase large subunit family protein n=1 Tax=Patulibacter defluvii TaxID=3095358 RepID=UPI002A761A2A|nr:methylmalonyl-CoA mutase family protein [Patulibacter sp. DM4]
MTAAAGWRTRSGIALDPVYDPAALAARGAAPTEPPGTPPFTRGIDPDGYREQPWIIGQYLGFGDAEDANERLRLLLAEGQTGFSIALDLPTQMGLDSDHQLAHGEVGKVGVAIDSLADVEALFDGVPLEQVRQIRTTANAIGPIWLALVVALARRRGIDPNAIRILIQNDVLKEYVARGTYIYPARPAVELVADTIEHCARHLPNWTPLAMSGYHIREAGADAAQELAFTFANGIAYCQAAQRRGVAVERFAPSLFTFLSAGTDLLEEVAKFRAARRVWARMVAERLGCDDPASQALRIFGFSAGSSLTAQQPLNNVVRVTVAALAAVLGGVQTLHTASFDEALATPTERAATLAVRTQQILRDEVGVRGTADPLGGSWAVESLTHEIERRVWAIVERIDELGGAIQCVTSGWFAGELADGAYEDQLAVERGERTVIGVNAHRDEDERVDAEVFAVDPAAERRQVARLTAVRERRSADAVEAALARLEETARGGGNVVEPTIAAVEAYATVGEICERLRRVHGGFTSREAAA